MKFNTLIFAISLLPTILMTSCNHIDEEVIFVEEFERYQEYQSGNRVLTDYSDINQIDIYWNNGKVNLIKDPTYSVVTIIESNCSYEEAEIPLQSLVFESEEKKTLSIQYLRPGKYVMPPIKKDLEIRIPESFQVDTINVHTITADLTSTIDFNDGYFYSQSGDAKIKDDDVHLLVTDSRHGIVEVETKHIHNFFAYNFFGSCTLTTETFDFYEIRCQTGYGILDMLGSFLDFSFIVEVSKTTGNFISNREFTLTDDGKLLFGSSESEMIGNAVINIYEGSFFIY